MKNEISVTQKLEGMMKELVSINMDTAKKVEKVCASYVVGTAQQKNITFSVLTTEKRARKMGCMFTFATHATMNRQTACTSTKEICKGYMLPGSLDGKW